MMESDREDPARVERLRNEIATLKAQVATVQSLRQAEAGVMEYLRNQSEAVDRDRIHEAIAARRATILKALRQLVEGGKVKRTGTGIKGDRYRYQISGTQVPDMDAVPGNQNTKNNGSDNSKCW